MIKEILRHLSKEQLIYLLGEYQHSLFLIGETCVSESKGELSAESAIRQIRTDIYHMPTTSNVKFLQYAIDLKLGKITTEEFRKKMGLTEDDKDKRDA